MKDTADTAAEIERIKQGSRWLWSQGDYPVIARLLEAPATELARRVAARGSKVLDVAAGNGNFALAAARLDADVTATDFSPRMVELGRARTEAAGVNVAWREADAESLPFADGEFDVAASVFGAIFAPRPELVARELFRVVRPGGTVAMLNYDGGYFRRVSEVIGRFSTASAPALPSPFQWGDQDEVRRRFAPYTQTIEFDRGTLHPGYDSFEDWRLRFAAANPPLMAMKAILPASAYEGLERDVWALYEEQPESDYLMVIATNPRG
jgi:SAM-dependent methyltransferase